MCRACGYSYEKIESNSVFQVGIPEGQTSSLSLKVCMERRLASQVMPRLFCPNCKLQTDWIEECKIKSLPSMLIISINRTGMSGTSKDCSAVSVPHQLNLDDLLEGSMDLPHFL